jgi:hypothetical protein
MKVVQTIAVASDTTELETWLAFHFAAGVDEIVLAGAQSADPRVHTIVAEAQLGKTAADLGADWVIDARPGEYWWPRGESLKDVLAPIPPRYTVVQALRRELDGELKHRRSVEASGTGEPAAMLRPIRRSGATTGEVPLRAWYPVEVLEAGAARNDEAALVPDTRLHDALQAIRAGETHAFATPDIVDDAAYAVDCAAVGEVDLPRLEQYVTELEQRVGWLEQRFWPRMLRSASRLVRRRSP